jgi:hypothetical protein
MIDPSPQTGFDHCFGKLGKMPLEFTLLKGVEPTPFCPRCVSCLILTQREFGRKAACRIYASTKTDAQRHSSSSTKGRAPQQRGSRL